MGYSDEDFRSDAPWRDKTKKVMVRVKQTLVCDYEVEVQEDATKEEIECEARNTRLRPSVAMIAYADQDDWYLENETIEII